MKKIGLLLSFFALGVIGMAQTLVVQAESGTFAGKIDTQYTGYTGTGFVDGTNAIGNTISWEVSILNGGAIPVSFRYAHGKTDDRSVAVFVNDVKVITSQAFAPTGGFSTWSNVNVTLNLNKGTNKIALVALTANGYANMDKMELTAEQGATQYQLALTIQGKGTVAMTPTGPYFDAGTVVTLTATANDGAVFNEWQGAATGTATTTTVTVNALTSVTAVFKSLVHGKIYCSPTGDDATATGAIDKPFFNLDKAVDACSAGDSIVMRGGLYSYNHTQEITKNGTVVDSIWVVNYPGEKPVLDWKLFVPATEDLRFYARGITHKANYYHYEGLELQFSPDNGFKMEGSHNTIKLCVFHDNGDSGMQIGQIKGATNDGTLVCYNDVIYCDAYNNADPATAYENADGFACKLYPGPGNRYIGCRAWNNCDDGWDFYMTVYPIQLIDCWAFNNGNPAQWGFTTFNGDGNGFKLGGDGEAAKTSCYRCVAFNCIYGAVCGFNDNNNGDILTLTNCAAWHCGKNIKLNGDGGNLAHVVRNSVAFDPQSGSRFNIDVTTATVQDHVSWLADGKDGKGTAADFISIKMEDALAPRQANGALPNNGFAKLVAGSDLIDAGVVSNECPTFFGAAPDMAPYESNYNATSIANFEADNTLFTVTQTVVEDWVVINYNLPENGDLSLKIIDVMGKSVYSNKSFGASAGQFELPIEVSNLNSGVYIVVVNFNGVNYSSKIVKK